MRKIDLTGRRFGRLTVIREAAKLPGNNNRRWECRCDCGKIVAVTTAKLNGGRTRSCGCLIHDSVIKIGQKYGRLTVTALEQTETTKNKRWVCICDCGNITSALTHHLLTGTVQSCGCLNREKHTTHGARNHRLYSIWDNMKARCNNPKQRDYKRYGGRGIKICDEWHNDFKVFYEWAMANGYQDDLQIDRIDNDGNYEPDNCRWVTPITQQSNTSRSVTYTVNCITKTQREWERELGMGRGGLWRVRNSGRNVEEYIQKRLEGKA